MSIKKIIWAVWVLLCVSNISAQQSVYTCDFEDEAERQQWTLNASRMRLLNIWCFGAAGDFSEKGNQGLFISTDLNQVDPTYDATNTMFVTAVREFSYLPQGKYRLYFDWRCCGKQSTSEGLYVCWVPADQVTNSAANAGGLPQWAQDYRCGTVFAGEIQWSVGQVDIEHDGTPHLLVLLWFNTAGSVATPSACIDTLELRPLPDTGEPNCRAVHNVTHKIQGDTVLLSWSGDAQYYDLRCYDYVSDTWYVRSKIQQTSCIVPGIAEGVHSFIIRAYCGDASASDYVQYTKFIFHKGTRCVEYLDLQEDGKCFIGEYTTYKNSARPFKTEEQVDYGYNDMNSRHTLHYVADEYDANTNYQLRTIPEGYLASVRLGDMGVGDNPGTGNGTGESIEYKYTVEDGASSILKIKYAVVLTNPHGDTPEQNPQFWLEVLCDGKSLSHSCGFAAFTAGDSQDWGWKVGATVNGGGFGTETSLVWLYKDWSEHAVNLRDYVGKTLTIRLVTTDCEPSGHTGYVYFVLDCDDGELSGLNCGEDNPTTEFEAPSGFNYKWYLESDPATTLGTDQKFQIGPMDINTYCVNVINKKNPNCWYTLSVRGLPRIPTPLALYEARVIDCQNVVTFENHSYVTLQNQLTGQREITDEPVTSLTWDFGDGTVQESSPDMGALVRHIYPMQGGKYTVTLTAGLSNGACEVSREIVVNLPDLTSPNTEVVHHLCRDEYPQGFQYDGRLWTEDIDTIFTYISQAGCDSLCHVVLSFHDTEYRSIVDTICQGDSLIFASQLIQHSGIYTDTLTSVFGCDSIVELDVYVEPQLQVNMADSIFVCLEDQVLDFSYEILQGSMEQMIIDFDSLACGAGFMPRYIFTSDDMASIAVPDKVIPNIYSAVVSYQNSYCDIASDTVTIELAYPSSIATVKTNLLAVMNEDNNGGYLFDSIQWYRDGELIDGATSANLAVDAEDLGHSFTVTLIRAGEQVAVGSCPIVYVPTAVESVAIPTMTWPAQVYTSLGLYLGAMTWGDISRLSTGIYLLSDGKNTVKIIR